MLGLGVIEILDLRHWELPAAEKPTARRDFITEAEPHLCATEGQLAVIVLEHPPEIHEYALCCLRAEISEFLAGGPEHGREHEVEGEGPEQLVAVLRLDLELSNEIRDALLIESLHGIQYFLTALRRDLELLLVEQRL